MASFAKKFESAKQDWTTPDALFEPINAEFGFTLDAAANAANARAENFFCAADDGLRQDCGSIPPTESGQESYRIGSKRRWKPLGAAPRLFCSSPPEPTQIGSMTSVLSMVRFALFEGGLNSAVPRMAFRNHCAL